MNLEPKLKELLFLTLKKNKEKTKFKMMSKFKKNKKMKKIKCLKNSLKT